MRLKPNVIHNSLVNNISILYMVDPGFKPRRTDR
jgi:hypothetical protein